MNIGIGKWFGGPRSGGCGRDLGGVSVRRGLFSCLLVLGMAACGEEQTREEHGPTPAAHAVQTETTRVPPPPVLEPAPSASSVSQAPGDKPEGGNVAPNEAKENTGAKALENAGAQSGKLSGKLADKLGSKADGKVANGELRAERTTFELYIMSKCPLAPQVVSVMSEILKDIGPYLDFRIDYVVNMVDGAVTADHSPVDLAGDTIQLCLAKYLPDNYAYVGVVACIMNDSQGIPDNWVRCAATENVGQSVQDKVRECAASAEGEGLLKASAQRARDRSVLGSPTMFIGGLQYRGRADKAGLMRVICGGLDEQSKPAQCQSYGASGIVNGILISDRRCEKTTCDPTFLSNAVSSAYPNMQLRKVDWSSFEAKRLCSDEGILNLPVLLVEGDLSKAGPGPAEGLVKVVAGKTGRYQVMSASPAHNPRSEVCDNGYDEDADGLVDCADPECAASPVCKYAKAGKLELFVMSKCPFAMRAMEFVGPLVKFLGKDVVFELHFIGTEVRGELTSMHGVNEVKGDVVEACLQKVVADKNLLFPVIVCMNKMDIIEFPAGWGECARTVGLPAAVVDAVKKCTEDGEGTALVKADFVMAQERGIRGSPTWVVDGVTNVVGVLPSDILKKYCVTNKDKAICGRIENLTDDAINLLVNSDRSTK